MQKGQAITMSRKESERVGTIELVSKRQISQKEAAKRLGISDRQVKRLVKRFKEEGGSGLVSRKRGQPSNNQLDPDLRAKALTLVRETYSDFGPTLACEKLKELHDIHVSRESLRQLMITHDLWRPKQRKRPSIHQTRERRACFGDMIQIDGSPHDWFEGRAPRCTLIVWIDDATSRLVALKFMPSETTFGYMDMLRHYIDEHGLPVSLYSDKHSIFRQNMNNGEGDDTQFTQALRRLEIEPIHANTPQAKGRVERANKTLQDRLVKELRLREISSIEAANEFLVEYAETHNKKFARPPRDEKNSHRSCELNAQELDLHCALHNTRTLSKNLTLSYNNTEYQLTKKHHERRLRGKKVTVIENSSGQVSLVLEGTLLEYEMISVGSRPIPLDDEKTVEERVEKAKRKQRASVTKGRKPSPDNTFNSFTPKASSKRKKKNAKTSSQYYDHLARHYV